MAENAGRPRQAALHAAFASWALGSSLHSIAKSGPQPFRTSTSTSITTCHDEPTG